MPEQLPLEPRRTISFFVAGVPQPKGSMTAFARKIWNPVKAIHDTAVAVTSSNRNLKAWQYAINTEARRQGSTFAILAREVPVSVSLLFYLPRPISLPKKQRAAIRKPDLDKLIRAALDALTGVLFVDDSQVVRLDATKAYASREEAYLTLSPAHGPARGIAPGVAIVVREE